MYFNVKQRLRVVKFPDTYTYLLHNEFMQICDLMASFLFSLALRPFRFTRICKFTENWYIPALGAVKRPFLMLKAFPLWKDPAAKDWKVPQWPYKQQELIGGSTCLLLFTEWRMFTYLMKRMKLYECFAIHYDILFQTEMESRCNSR